MMHHHSPVMKAIGFFVWLVTSLGAIYWGMQAIGYDFFQLSFIQSNLGSFVEPFKYLIGICGVISLIMLFMACTSKDACCK